ncbi:MAG: class I SAM-dependent methyltransferase [Alphaproteobacteria bacterium]|nr:class I SAM-dependent methyltransferase [Alphaproteobacteria bacterium]
MISNSLKTLIYTIERNALSFERGCFVNGAFDLSIKEALPPAKVHVVTPHYQVHTGFLNHSYTSSSTIPKDVRYDACFVLLPKQAEQSLYDIASALMHLEDNGTLILCAAKNAGGARLQKILKAFGLEVLQSFSKNHCKSVVTRKTTTLKLDTVKYCLEKGAPKPNQHGYLVKPGVFGWNKIDTGSELLARHIPNYLKDTGADFGCGYGYLTDQVFLKNHEVTHMTCLDVDYHAVESCKINLEKRHKDRSYNVIWSDLTKECPVEHLGFIVMNPPFHEGKDHDMSLGKNMITAAHKALGQYGELYMVANNHLPYENILNDLFFQVEVLAQEKGFKIFKALK